MSSARSIQSCVEWMFHGVSYIEVIYSAYTATACDCVA